MSRSLAPNREALAHTLWDYRKWIDNDWAVGYWTGFTTAWEAEGLIPKSTTDQVVRILASMKRRYAHK